MTISLEDYLAGLDGTGKATIRASIGLIIGTDVQAQDSDLAAIAALSTTSFGRSLLTLADAAAGRTALGVAIGSDVQAYDADLAAIAALSTTSFGRSFLALADAAAARTLIGAVIGTDVQAHDAGLDTIAAATPIADGPHTVGSNTITTAGGIITAIS